MAYDLASIAREYPFEPQSFLVDGHTLSYLDEGPREAPVIMFLHGNPTWSFYYRKLVLALRATHRVIAPDHIGCGLSDKPQDYAYRLANHIANVTSLVDHLGITKLSLGLHDWGGAIGFGYAVERPASIEKLVIFNTAAFRSMQIPARIAVCRIPFIGALMVRGFNAFVKSAVIGGMATAKPERFTADVKRGYLLPYDSWANRIATHTFVLDIPLNPSHPSYATLAAIDERLKLFSDTPARIFWGKRDFCFNDHFLDGWEKRLNNVEITEFDDAGHFVVEDAYEEIIPLVRTFLEEG